MANLAKTMPFACCPPAFVPSHDGGLFSAQPSRKQLFLRKQVGAPNGFLAEFRRTINVMRRMSSPSCPAPRQCRLSSTVLCTISTAGLPRQQLRRNQSTLRPKKAARPQALKCQSPARRLSRPDIHPPQVPSPAASKLMDQLDELASDLAAKGRSSSEEAVETMPETSPVSIELQAVEPSIQVPPRSDFGHNPFAAGSQPARRRMIVTSAGVCLAALLGAGIAWQSDFIAPTKSTNEFEPRRDKTGCHYVRSAAFGKRDPDPTGPNYTKPQRRSHRPNWGSNSRQWRKTWPLCGVVLSNSPPSRNSLPPPNNSWINSPLNKRNSSPSRNKWRKISRNCRRQSKA